MMKELYPNHIRYMSSDSVAGSAVQVQRWWIVYLGCFAETLFWLLMGIDGSFLSRAFALWYTLYLSPVRFIFLFWSCIVAVIEQRGLEYELITYVICSEIIHFCRARMVKTPFAERTLWCFIVIAAYLMLYLFSTESLSVRSVNWWTVWRLAASLLGGVVSIK